jgi:hypothetical protein
MKVNKSKYNNYKIRINNNNNTKEQISSNYSNNVLKASK